jgi:hypothetical protein
VILYYVHCQKQKSRVEAVSKPFIRIATLENRPGSANVSEETSVEKPIPLHTTRPQAPDYSRPIVYATETTTKRDFTDAILDWWDTHANHIFVELKQKTD